MNHLIPNGSHPDRVRLVMRLGKRLAIVGVVVLAVITIVSVSVPKYQQSLIRSKESVLKNNLFTLRTVIHEYTYHKQKGPRELQDLMTEGYLRDIPVDPMTK